MRVAEFEYYLPEDLIAQEPAPVRDESRLMVLYKDSDGLEHRIFKNITEYITPQDVLVLNDTKVIPARLWGKKDGSGTVIEVLLLTRRSEQTWETLVRPGRRVPVGTTIRFGDDLTGTVEAVVDDGCRLIKFHYQGVFEQVLERLGVMPLPPYIKKQPDDPGRYQTIYARDPGSAAAPTAGLHFTTELLQNIKDLGTPIVSVLLHVGLGTFRPVKVDEVTSHRMHAEFYAVPEETARVINETKARGGRVIAVGTTTTRCLETAARENGIVQAGSGWTEIFIYPGYHFQVVDALVTNFHLPRSTLLMMVSALVGRERLLSAYTLAVQLRYRFFSFGDAMLII